MIKFSTDIPKDYIALNWSVTRYCQFNCHYCTSKDFLISVKKTGLETAVHEDDLVATHDKIIDMIPRVVKQGHIFLTGGDPTAHPKGIEYFNTLCRELKNNENVLICLSTHGDVAVERLLEFDTHSKKDHLIIVSYHMAQVRNRFKEWVEKIKTFYDQGHNIVMSGVIPRQQKQWDQFKENLEYVSSLGIPLEIKPEICRQQMHTDADGLMYMKDLYASSVKERNPIANRMIVRPTDIEDDKGNKFTMNNIRIVNQVPLVPGRTFCFTKQFEINEDANIGYTCGQGGRIQLTPNTTDQEFRDFLYQQPLRCQSDICHEPKFVPEATVLGKDLTDEEYTKVYAGYYNEEDIK
jgi:organic radical activating enzyme